MPEGLLRTKLFAPPPRLNQVHRLSLLDKLNSARRAGVPCALVSAPAGFGKTTLIGDWVRASGPPYAWFALDDSDNDPLRFWRYVDAALQTIDIRIGETLRPALYSMQAPVIHQIITGMLNDIISLEKGFILVLEDYHVIEHADIHESLNFLLDHMPPQMQLVITTRSDPPLNLAKRRGRGQLIEIRATDLRFTSEEIVAFLNQTMLLDLTDGDIAALGQRTEGWIAGLQMVALSMQDETDRHAFVAAFSGDDHYIADYLMEEVLQRQPVEFQLFLQQTSILDRMNASLCDAVTGRQDSRAMLNILERANLFILPLDNHREWFRYHHLFASLLQKRLLDAAGPGAVRDLKHRASQWHAAHGDVVNAVEIALSCDDFEQAITVIEASGGPLFIGAELNTLRQWVERIPAEVVADHPRLNVMATWASHATGKPQQAERFVQLLEEAIGVSVEDYLEDSPNSRGLSPLQRSALLEGAAVRARIAVDTLNLEKSFNLGKRSLPHMVNIPGEPFAFNPPANLRGPMLFCIGLVHEFQGDMAEAASLFVGAETEGMEYRNPHIIALAIGHLGGIQTMLGQKQQARATYERGLKAAQLYSPQSSAFWGLASVGLGNLAFEEGDLGNARSELESGVELGKIWNTWEVLLPGMLGLSRIHAAHGEWGAASATLDDLLERTAANALMVLPVVEAQRAAIQLQQGDLATASHWAASFNTAQPAPYHIQWEQNALIVAQIWLAQGKKVEAESLLTRLLSDAESAGRVQTVQQISHIRRATSPISAQQTKNSMLVEPLSERELEVLRLMAEGLSTAEMAKKLFLTPNTLKAHTHRIFGKLGVHGRIQAVIRARELGIL
jgi:LuxR family transcriptional regulator, maltose regulon positive regulatory protein